LAGLLWQDADLYVVCYYIGADGTIKARYQRNEFNDEATIGNPNITLKALTKVDAIDRRICLWAMESAANRAATRQVLFRTAPYNPLPLIHTDAGALQTEPQGAVTDQVRPGGTFAEASLVTVDVQGAVASTIQLVTITPEAATLDVEPQGAVVGSIQDAGTFTDAATLSVEPQGVTVEAVEAVPAIVETATMATSPQGAIQNV
jgi:hypothetical protein